MGKESLLKGVWLVGVSSCEGVWLVGVSSCEGV